MGPQVTGGSICGVCGRYVAGPDTRLERPRSPIRRNDALAKLILERAGSFTLEEIVAECRERFGRAAPSRSAVHRFLQEERLKTAVRRGR